MKDKANETNWQVQATAWELLALAFRNPNNTLTEAVMSGEWYDAASEISEALVLDLPEGWNDGCDAAIGKPSDEYIHTLRAEHTRLFVGAPEPVVSPYEGVWAAHDDGVQPLLFVNPKSMAVERFCKACGLGRPEGTNEPFDYVATECELLEYLALLAGGMAQVPENGPAGDAFPGGSPAAAYEQFLTEHARAWMPRFAEAVVEASREPFFRAAAHMLAAVVSK